MAKQLGKKQALLEVIKALMNDNNRVYVETVDAQSDNGQSWHSVAGDKRVFTPVAGADNKLGNRIHANSIKIGADVSIVRQGPAVLVKTAQGEVKFDFMRDEQLDLVWGAALNKYEHGANSDFMYPVHTYMHDEDLRMAAKGERVLADKVSKYAKSMQKLQSLGINSDRVVQYMAEQTMQNG